MVFRPPERTLLAARQVRIHQALHSTQFTLHRAYKAHSTVLLLVSMLGLYAVIPKKRILVAKEVVPSFVCELHPSSSEQLLQVWILTPAAAVRAHKKIDGLSGCYPRFRRPCAGLPSGGKKVSILDFPVALFLQWRPREMEPPYCFEVQESLISTCFVCRSCPSCKRWPKVAKIILVALYLRKAMLCSLFFPLCLCLHSEAQSLDISHWDLEVSILPLLPIT